MTPAEIAEYYQGLLIMQYSQLPKAVATINLLATELIADNVYQQVMDGFDIETAVGAQLDILATYVGAQRQVFGVIASRNYFQMPAYEDPNADTSFGYIEYGDDINLVDWYYLTYEDANQPVYFLNDSELRRFIQYLAALHASDHSLENLDDILFKFFGNNVTMTDNMDMTIDYTHNPLDLDTLFTIVAGTGNLPHPAGVEINVV